MNFFSVLADSDNEDTVKVVPKKGAAPTKKDAAPTKKDAAPVKKDAAPAKKDAAPAKKDAAPAKKADGKVREPKVSHAASNAVDAGNETGKDDNRGGHRNRERHGEKAGRGAQEGERRPKRDFDRRSGTGRGREVSRGGRGAYGAGNPSQDALDAEKNPKAAIEGAVDGVADVVDEEAVVEEEVAEPEPVTFTLDEFMRKREEARQKLADLAVAPTASRTVDKDTEFAGMTTVSSEVLEDYLAPATTKAEVGRKDQRSTGKTQVLNVGFKFPAVQPERERDSRGGRGEGRGGRGEGRGGRRGGRGEGRGVGRGRAAPRSGSAPSAFNAADFPSL